MKELSLNLLDIAENSVKAKATLIFLNITETENTVLLSVKDNGTGMTADFLKTVTNPFSTTRTTRKVGLGIPLLKLEAEQTGGYSEITSKHFSEYPDSHGTETKALFYKNHIDFTPLGDMKSTVVTLIQGNPDIDFVFTHKAPSGTVSLDTRELRQVLDGVPLNNTEVLCWIAGNLDEQYKHL